MAIFISPFFAFFSRYCSHFYALTVSVTGYSCNAICRQVQTLLPNALFVCGGIETCWYP
jgi:hypothetical protein